MSKLFGGKEFVDLTPVEILKFYYDKYGSFRVMRFLGRPHKWFVLDKHFFEEKHYATPNQRQILPDEVVFDIDVENHSLENEDVGLKLANKILKRMEKEGVKASLWFSGGSGYHLHCFFPEMMKYSKPHRKILRRLVLRHFGIGYLKPTHPAHVCMVPKTLIQLENEIHRKNHGFKKWVGGYKPELTWDNKLPEWVLERFERVKNKVWLRIKKPYLAVGGEPNCIKALLSNDFLDKKDGRKRVVFILASYYKRVGLSEREILQKLEDYNSYQLNNYLKESYLKSVAKTVNGSISCKYIKSFLSEFSLLGVCEGCKNKLVPKHTTANVLKQNP